MAAIVLSPTTDMFQSFIKTTDTTILVAQKILLTLAYSDQFQFPLTKNEIRQRLIWYEPVATPDFEQIETSLEFLKDHQLVESIKPVKKSKFQQNEYYVLNGHSHWVDQREQRAILARQKYQHVENFLKWARHIPWIRGVAVTGSVAVANADEKTDIDFMIITSRNRLWLTRVLLGVIAKLRGRRRTRTGHTIDTWCFNLWMEETALNLPQSKQDVYGAYEVCQADWVLDKANVALQFYQENAWVQEWLPEMYQQAIAHQQYKKIPTKRGSLVKSLATKLLTLVNQVFFYVQLIYMYPHMTREIVLVDRAFFHPRNTKKIIMTNWAQSLKLLELRWQANKQNQSLVLVTGVFDLLHSEHRNFLAKAKNEGVLLVGVESDARVRSMKGPGRPIQNQQQRVAQLQDSHLPDAVFILPEQFDRVADQRRLLHQIRPDVLAVSSHTPHLIAKEALMKEIGGEVRIVHQQNPAISTTQLINSFPEVFHKLSNIENAD